VGQWKVQQDVHLLSRHYWMKLTGKGRTYLTVHGKSNFYKNQARLACVPLSLQRAPFELGNPLRTVPQAQGKL
jgi:hypothetical protein